jgi:hypothetical protein
VNMKCDRYQDMIMRHFDHVLIEEERKQLVQHIESCQHCRALMDDLQGIMQTLETSPQVEPPPDLEKLVMNRIQSLPASTENSSNNFLKALYGSISIAAVMLASAFTLGLHEDSIPSIISHGATGLFSFLENVWNFQIVYNLLSGVFPQIISSISKTIQAVYIIAGFAAIIMGVKSLLLQGQDFQKAKE